MDQPSYDEMVQFASQGALDPELRQAKLEYVARTGDMFEGDVSFERRLASFLEWYVLDRAVSFAPSKTPAKLYIDSLLEAGQSLDVQQFLGLTQSILSLFEYGGSRGDHLHMSDVLTGQKYRIFTGRQLAGLDSGDLLEARLVPLADRLELSDTLATLPRQARRHVLRAGKAFRKRGAPQGERLDLVHRVAFLSQRCERYRHVDAATIFAQL